jgi:hypothetical protein
MANMTATVCFVPMVLKRKRAGSRDEIAKWCARQLARRAESREAWEGTAEGEDLGIPRDEILISFFTSHWVVVVKECGEHFNNPSAAPMFTDLRAMEDAIRSAAHGLWPVVPVMHALAPGTRATDDVAEAAVVRLRHIAQQNGWR